MPSENTKHPAGRKNIFFRYRRLQPEDTGKNNGTPDMPANEKLELINLARSVLRGQRTMNSGQLKELYKELVKRDQFAYATEVLLRKMEVDKEEGRLITIEDFQTLAKFIYKDHSLPSSFKLNRALKELKTHDDLASTQRCETLGLVGAIYKRKWQFDHQFKNLVLSRYYYRKGFALWRAYIKYGGDLLNSKDPGNDGGYTAINSAYINELIAVDKLEEHGKITGITPGIYARVKEALRTRKYILKQFIQDKTNEAGLSLPSLNSDQYEAWVIATVAEAYFGLRQYDNALHFIIRYIALKAAQPWEIRSFQQQLYSIAYLQQFQQQFIIDDKNDLLNSSKLNSLIGLIDYENISRCLAAFDTTHIDGSVKDAVSISPKKGGKFGLALSGGGFRASLFHIGVLAALAERNELKNVEVLSCVSGGSIIGAFYYLKLKVLLETKSDKEIEQKDYITIVQEIEKDFLEGVQKNLRMHLFSNLACNFRMLFDKYYSRTHRLGELYERYLYKPVLDKSESEAYQKLRENHGGNIYMTDLFIRPKDDPENFVPANDNWRRQNKVPQLVLNATTVNTGHNWQFTASWMGEPPGNILTDIDVKPRLRRMYYQEAPERYRKFRLGYAVGASSCVPVMFKPMPLRDLYPGIDLQLIDGGLHDNQGIASLIEQECNNMIISDASGQLPTNVTAAKNEAALFYRADNILQERLRELQFQDIKERNNTTQVNKLLTVHLKNCLQQSPMNWKYCVDPPRSIMYTNTKTDENALTEYGLLRSVQTQLSEVRTDLDSFSDTEAYALMYSGYAQIHYEYDRQKEKEQERTVAGWNFLKIKDYVTLPEKADMIRKRLNESKRLAFKIIFLSPPVRIGFLILGFLTLAGLIYLVIMSWNVKLLEITVKLVVLTIIGFVLGLISPLLSSLFNYKSTIRRYLKLIALSLGGYVVSQIYLKFLNNRYNKIGKID